MRRHPRATNYPPPSQFVDSHLVANTNTIATSAIRAEKPLPSANSPERSVENTSAKEWRRKLYIKTNLPAWLCLWTNIAGEIDLAPHWSANLSIYYSGWDYFKRKLKFRTLTIMPEARYWFKSQNDGFFAGLHPGLAYYNIATAGGHRYQDHDENTPAIGGGASVGFRFAVPRNPRWKFEASVGYGIYRLDYDIFRNHANGPRVERRKRTFYGIDNIAFSVCYTFDVTRRNTGDKARKGGEPR